MELRDLIERIDALKATIEGLRPIPSDVEGRILQKLRLDWNYHSSNIEGNALTYGETKTLLLHGLTVGGKPLRDYLEVRGHNDAIFELEDIVRSRTPLTEHTIKGMHQLILGRESYRVAAMTPDGVMTERLITPGRYKLEPNHVRTVTGEMFYFTSPENTAAEMGELMAWYNEAVESGELHPLVIGAIFHYRFVRIHPFDDGNGRLARILMNLAFMKHGYPPAIIRTEEKESYFRALQTGDGGEIDAFVVYAGEQLLRSCEIYLRGARGEKIDEAEDIDRRIALFKAEAMKEKDLLPAKVWTAATRQEVYDTVLYPIIEYVRTRLSGFDELFADTRDTVQAVSAHASFPEYSGPLLDPPGVSSWLERKFTEAPRLITIKFRWRGYRHAGTNVFDVDATLVFKVDEFVFKLYTQPDGELLFSKRYDQPVSEEELTGIATWYVEFLMREIESHAATAL